VSHSNARCNTILVRRSAGTFPYIDTVLASCYADAAIGHFATSAKIDTLHVEIMTNIYQMSIEEVEGKANSIVVAHTQTT